MNAQKNTALSVLSYHGSHIAFEANNGLIMVNATQMAKPFGKSKKPDNWLRTQQTRELLNVVAVSHKCATADLQLVRQGGINQGTWFQEDVALLFAQWLSPEFYLACNHKLKEIVMRQAFNLPVINGVHPMYQNGVLGYPRKDILISLGKSCKNGYRLARKYAAECFVLGRTSCISSKLAHFLVDKQKLAQRQLDMFSFQKELS